MRAWWVLLVAFGSLARAEPAPWYTVEVIIFEQLNGDAPDGEVWPRQVSGPNLDGAVELTAPGSLRREPAGATGPASARPRAFTRLSPKELKLGGVSRKLRRDSAYRPLLHVAWRQPGFTRAEARPVHIDSAATGLAGRRRAASDPAAPPDVPRVNGTIRVYRARYLHVEVDLVYSRPASTAPPPVGATTPRGPGPPAGGVGLAGAGTATDFRLRESRRMRSRKLHYFDHPRFGVLVKIEPFQPLPAPPETVSPVTTPSAGDSPAPPGRATTIPLPPRN